MRSSTWMSVAARGLLPALLLTSCTAYHPYGAGGYPGYYQGQPGQYQPGVIQPGAIPNNGALGNPAPIEGGGNSVSPGSAASRGVPSGIEANRNNANPSPGGNLVPDSNYDDPRTIEDNKPMGDSKSSFVAPAEKKPAAINASPLGGGSASLGSPTGGVQLTSGQPDTAFGKSSATGSPAAVDNRQFSQPRPIQPDPNAQPLAAPAPGGNAAADSSPYGFDSEKYSWLRGKVDFDEGSKTWQIIYNLNPTPADAYGGSLTLVDHPRLQDFRNDDIALIEGEIDTSGGPGKPRYKIVKVFHPLKRTAIPSPTEAGPAIGGEASQAQPGKAAASPFGNR